MKTVFPKLEIYGEIMDLLTELEEYFEDRADMNDGSEGKADQPNDAMRFMTAIQAFKQCAKEI